MHARRASLWTAALAGAAGAAAWAIFAAVQDVVPEGIRVTAALALFLLGPGAALTAPLLRHAPALDRLAVALGFGVAAAPALAQALALAGLGAAFPYLCGALAGIALARRAPVGAEGPLPGVLCLAVATVALALGAAAYAGRLEAGPQGIVVYGDYDSFDSTYYAAVSAELSGGTMPPQAPFQAGRSLNYSYFPHLLVGSIHRFTGVPLLTLYFVYAWPLLLAVTATAGFALLRRLSTARAAFLGILLLLVGSDLSFVVPLLGDPSRLAWDPVIWSTNFFSPGAETLLFNTWTPALAVLFTGFYAFDRFSAGESRGWGAAAAACFAWLVPFKTFAFAAVAGALLLTAAAGRDGPFRRRAAAVAIGTAVFAAPYLADIAVGYADSQAVLTLQPFVIPTRLADRLDLPELLAPVLAPLPRDSALRHAAHLGAAVGILFVGGLGFRLAGVPALWRALRRPDAVSPAWTLIGWTAAAGALIPFAIATEPYHGTLHFYQTTLFLMPLFVGPAIDAWLQGRRVAGLFASALVIAAAVPSTAHYLDRKRSDRARALARLDAGGVQIAGYLAHVDPDAVILHDDPADPSLFTVVSGRRTVLAWSRYARGSAEREADVGRFFASAGGDPGRAWEVLRKYRVRYVIASRADDAIHPEVLERLRLVMRTPSTALYEVRLPGPLAGPAMPGDARREATR